MVVENSHVAAERELLRLNLGSGDQWAEGWVSLDNSLGVRLAHHPLLKSLLHAILPSRLLPSPDWSARITWANLTKGLPYASGSVDALYTSHFLEHLPHSSARLVLAECHRMLRPGGTLRIVVPDLSPLVERYLRDRDAIPEQAARAFHQDTGYFEVPPPACLRDWLLFPFRLRANHAFLYDEAVLEADLVEAGLEGVTRRSFGDSAIPGIEAIELESRLENALCLEAAKP